ncbi:MAG: lytic murein transglycosylase [Primorskyibacter sp.]
MRRSVLSLVLACTAMTAQAQVPCGGSFSQFVNGLVAEAQRNGHSRSTARAFFNGVQQDAKVLRADRAQGIFQSGFIDFSRKLINSYRLDLGRKKAAQYDRVFDRIERQYGVSRGVLLAFWAFETDYGGYQGNFNTRDALVTLAHDCRRPELFRPQVLAALELYARGEFNPTRTTGAWAGEIGMVQMLPADIIENGVDGDGDGQVSLKTSAPDALMSGGKMLQSLGWAAGQPWLQEVSLPRDFNWASTGLATTRDARAWARAGVTPRSGAFLNERLPASIIIPQGHKGPAFIAYPNFSVLFEWNQSFTYVLTAAYFATRLEGAPVYRAGSPDAGLSADQMKRLQRRLQARGHDVGKLDGILGAKTREAVRVEQQRLGFAVDAWPTPALLSRL